MFTITFVSILAASSAPSTVKPLDVPAGWTCRYESLAQSFDERAGRDNAQGDAVRVCESASHKGGK